MLLVVWTVVAALQGDHWLAALVCYVIRMYSSEVLMITARSLELHI